MNTATLPQIQVGTFRDLMGGHTTAKIFCAMSGAPVRQLTVVGKDIVILAGDGTRVTVPLDEPIRYQPWCMDRGSLLFGKNYKIATELDTVEYPDSSTPYVLVPKK